MAQLPDPEHNTTPSRTHAPPPGPGENHTTVAGERGDPEIHHARTVETPGEDPTPALEVETVDGREYTVSPDYPVEEVDEALATYGGHEPGEPGHPTTPVTKTTSRRIVVTTVGGAVVALLLGLIAMAAFGPGTDPVEPQVEVMAPGSGEEGWG